MHGTVRVLVRVHLALSLGTAACASTIRHPAEGHREPLDAFEPSAGDGAHDMIVERELRRLQGTNAAAAVRELRPTFLRSSGTPIVPHTSRAGPVVFVNGHYAGELDVLEMIPLAPVVEIRRLRPMAAYSLFGSQCPCADGAILVRTRTSDR
jgi:hypothetical protein